tara:strand:+ start:739 stop:1698 length:960 start_codon:yes stop_codon:yes gene_type:complete
MTSIGFGTWAWGNQFLWGYKPEEDDDRLKQAFETAINGGLNLIDTADSYGTGSLKGRSEELLGKFLSELPKSKLKTITVATKLAPYPWRQGRNGFKNAFKSSKKRLKGKLDRIQIHWSTSRYAPWQEVQLIDGLADLLEEGFVDEIGVSNMGPQRLKWIHERLISRNIKIKSLQTQLSLLSPNPNGYLKLKEICKELNIEILGYSPLALGILAINPKNEKLPKGFVRRRIFIQLLKSSKNLRQNIYEISTNRNVSQAQVALNWCRAKGAIPIPGIRTSAQAKDVIAAKEWGLSEKEILKLDDSSLRCLKRMPNNPFQSD